MMVMENLRMAIASLKANKSRALLTMLGIIIGIAAVIAIMTVGNSVTNTVSSSMQSMGVNNINVMIQSRKNEPEERESGIVFGAVEHSKEMTERDYLTDEMIAGLLEEFSDEIEAISASEAVGSCEVKNGSASANVTVTGVSQGYFAANEKTMLAGRLLSAEEATGARNAAVVSSEFVDDLLEVSYEEAVGRSFSCRLGEQQVQYTIVGVYEQVDSATAMMMGLVGTECYIPLTTAQQFNHTENYQNLAVVGKVGVDADALARKIETYLDGHYRSNRYFEVSAFSMSAMVTAMADMMDTIVTAISVIAGIALLVGGIGVMNIMLVSVTERTREIGTRKALGATNESIRMQFIVEAMIMCLLGGIIGVILGVAGGILASNLMGAAAAPSVGSIVISLLFSLAIGVFFGYYPANKAAKMNPIDALRYE
ncbi:MAG: ABC transporter permease [Oscillospiraceae bacterium]|nr:ABC transporter permease [Oscillospiraceae bacterium]